MSSDPPPDYPSKFTCPNCFSDEGVCDDHYFAWFPPRYCDLCYQSKQIIIDFFNGDKCVHYDCHPEWKVHFTIKEEKLVNDKTIKILNEE